MYCFINTVSTAWPWNLTSVGCFHLSLLCCLMSHFVEFFQMCHRRHHCPESKLCLNCHNPSWLYCMSVCGLSKLAFDFIGFSVSVVGSVNWLPLQTFFLCVNKPSIAVYTSLIYWPVILLLVLENKTAVSSHMHRSASLLASIGLYFH